MMFLFFLYIVKVYGNVCIDQLNNSIIQTKQTLFLIQSSSPGTGFMWYLLSENETKVKVEDVDGVYISGKPGYQNFTVYCTEDCRAGDVVKLSLILKRPWENYLSEIRFIDLIIVE